MLSGIRVVEIGAIGPGPFCAMHLADLGADVIVVERPNESESWSVEGRMLQRGKRSVVADLKAPEGRELVLRLIENADALIEGMRPGVMERLGLGPEDCHRRNQRLVYGRVTGWGQSGPLSMMPGHDNNYIALSGALYYSGTPSEPPSSPITLVGDIGGGALYLAVGLLSGVLHARSTGKGTVVDAAILDGSAHMTQLLLSLQHRGLLTGTRTGNFHDSSHFYGTYECACGGFITLGAIEPQFYSRLLEALELQEDPRFSSQWNRDSWPALQKVFVELFFTRTRENWKMLLEDAGVCFAPVLSAKEAAVHPHNIARETFVEQDGVLQAAPAPRFDGQTKRPNSIPSRGEHTDEILTGLFHGTTESVWRSGVAIKNR